MSNMDEARRLVRKALSIELLEARVIELEVRNLELLVHNNELLARARKAEAERYSVDEATAVLLTGTK